MPTLPQDFRLCDSSAGYGSRAMLGVPSPSRVTSTITSDALVCTTVLSVKGSFLYSLQLPPSYLSCILLKGWVHSWPSFPIVLNTGWNEFKQEENAGLPSVPREGLQVHSSV